jgi:hypothetical protein
MIVCWAQQSSTVVEKLLSLSCNLLSDARSCRLFGCEVFSPFSPGGLRYCRLDLFGHQLISAHLAILEGVRFSEQDRKNSYHGTVLRNRQD